MTQESFSALQVLLSMVDQNTLTKDVFIQGQKDWVDYFEKNPTATPTAGDLIRLGSGYYRRNPDQVIRL